MMSVLGAARAMALSKLLKARLLLPASIANRDRSRLHSSVISRSDLRTKSIMGNWRGSGLPVGNGAVWSEVRLSAGCDRLCNLGDLFQLFEVEFNPNAGTIVRVKLSVL